MSVDYAEQTSSMHNRIYWHSKLYDKCLRPKKVSEYLSSARWIERQSYFMATALSFAVALWGNSVTAKARHIINKFIKKASRILSHL